MKFLALVLLLIPSSVLARAEWNPPARYDRPFSGTAHITYMAPPAVPQACELLFKRYRLDIQVSKKQRGCAVFSGDKCWIIAIDRPAYGTTPEAVVRHERGHCNGWPEDHPEY